MRRMRDFLDSLTMFWDYLPIPVRAALLTGVLTVLRFAYNEDARKWKRKILELCLCVATTWGVSSALAALGLSQDAAYLVAVAIGWEGADFVRERARSWVNQKSEGGPRNG